MSAGREWTRARARAARWKRAKGKTTRDDPCWLCGSRDVYADDPDRCYQCGEVPSLRRDDIDAAEDDAEDERRGMA